MQVRLQCGYETYLDELVMECILLNFSGAHLAMLCSVSKCLQAPTQAVAHRQLLTLMRRVQCTPQRVCEEGSRIVQLRQWEALERGMHVWLQADPDAITTVKQGTQQLVKSCVDLSGHGNGFLSGTRMPAFLPDGVNGVGMFEFDGHSVLKTRPFARALPQPVTLVVVARARGDTTIVDSLGPGCATPANVYRPAPAPRAPLPSPSQLEPLRALPRLPRGLAPVAGSLHDGVRP